MQEKLLVNDLTIHGRKVLVRVDYNVPLDGRGRLLDDTRIVATLPTLRSVLERGGALILMSHMGRPKGHRVAKLSLAPCAERLSQLLGMPVAMAPDCVGEEVERLAGQLAAGQVLLLENLRFHEAEEHPETDPSFAKSLAVLGDVYINDAFGTAHRAHTSTYSVPQLFPGKAAAGLLLEREIAFLGHAIEHPKRPFYALIGGAKIAGKIEVMRALMTKVDALFIAGAMAFTFAKAQGREVGDSLFEADLVEVAAQMMKECRQKGIALRLPEDVVIAEACEADVDKRVVTLADGIPPGYQGLDIGPTTVTAFAEEFQKAKTLLWNGPLGVFELPDFQQGTFAIARAVANLDATTIVGGGESVAAVRKAGVADRITHISTGGGAALEYIQAGTLPGIDALTDRSTPVNSRQD